MLLGLKLLLSYNQRFLLKSNHQLQLKQHQLFEAAFADSGYWDFAILFATDWFVRSVIVFTLSPISEFSMVEKIGQRLTDTLHEFKNKASWNFVAFEALSSSLFYGLSFFVFVYGLTCLSVFF